jgi:CheY-like chemotaxis protein
MKEILNSKIRSAWIIDDAELSQVINKFIIKKSGLVDRCVLHENGATALQRLKQKQSQGLDFPDVIVLVLNMPVMNGFEFLQHINEWEELSYLLKRTIVLSSSICTGDVMKVKSLGARWNLSKPLTVQAAVAIFSTVIEERDRRKKKKQEDNCKF